MLCMAILYPGMAIGIVSGNGNQARMVIKQKIEGELLKNENIKREILNIKTSADDCIVTLKNGSSIRAITLGMNQKGDSARGKHKIASLYRNVYKNKRGRIAGKAWRTSNYSITPVRWCRCECLKIDVYMPISSRAWKSGFID